MRSAERTALVSGKGKEQSSGIRARREPIGDICSRANTERIQSLKKEAMGS